MAKLTKSQSRKANELANVLGSFGFSDVKVSFDSRFVVSGKRDFLTANVTKFIPKNWMFYYDGVELDICIS